MHTIKFKNGKNKTFKTLVGADLSFADLRQADLRGADLTGAVLTRADLTSAVLSGAQLYRAILENANLSYAYLASANLSEAFLRDANLTGASMVGANCTFAALHFANLTDANMEHVILRCAALSGADLTRTALPDFQLVPEAGAFVGFKKLEDDMFCALGIPARAKRTSSLVGRKCRASEAKVLGIWRHDGISWVKFTEGISCHNPDFEYKVGETIRSDSWNDDIRIECTHGIHFFMTKKEALEFTL